jgi:CheY-like chemotaxis protein
LVLTSTGLDYKALLDGGDAVVSKPVTPTALRNAVCKALQLPSDAAPVSITKPQQLQGLHILVVDDCDVNREVAQLILGDEGASVTLAVDGLHALQWLSTPGQRVDIVLMDVQMPHMDGYEATRAIRSLPGCERLPVVALTAGAFEFQREVANAAGMDEFISKPFNVNATISLIQRLTEHRATVAAPVVEAAQPSTQADGGASFPGLDLRHGLQLWKDRATYGQRLQRFAQQQADILGRFQMLDGDSAMAAAHKLQGVAGTLGLPDLAAAAGKVFAALRTGREVHAALDSLQDAMAIALASIARYAPPTLQRLAAPDAEALAAKSSDALVARQLLDRLLDVWDSHDPDAVECELAELERLLGNGGTAGLHRALQDYDFHAGKVATQALMQELARSQTGAAMPY